MLLEVLHSVEKSAAHSQFMAHGWTEEETNLWSRASAQEVSFISFS